MTETWQGRIDGEGPEHLRWHRVVEPYRAESGPGACVFIGFASDEGVRRNRGRPGAAEGPAALRKALASMALEQPIAAFDTGDIEVVGGDLEAAQERLGVRVSELRTRGQFPVVLGGGHEVAWGSFQGLAGVSSRIGVLNLDAHFDLRADPIASSGTPFRQILEAGQDVRYDVIGISQPSNTVALFETARRLGVRFLLDDDCYGANVDRFLADFLEDVDLVYLSIDLDALPASVAPGVSAPAALGVELSIIQAVCDRVAASGKLALCDVAELNPSLDIDLRSARTAARLVHRIVSNRV